MTGLASTLRRPLNPVIAGILCAVFMIGSLAMMIQSRASILRDGTEIILKTEPIDPRDLMRGDYVRLQYDEISRPERALFSGDWPQQDRYAPLWLTLAVGEDGAATVTAISLERPVDAGKGTVLLRSDPVMLSADAGNQISQGQFALKFGIERYYVPEGEGLEIESARNAGRATAAIRVSKRGVAQIARLMIDGETLYQEPLY
ncbi:GDYXXLXY domain-containing protein [Hoeflea sp. G2-23]|uniref:GDYXXLXY domain-containing protein n=1 Tax=Hoeflea algicola TaxID=2983763 RepID=A0ABT3Z5M7_9HYPH|nr:GDYXXLXY domain-containing protein [Hoeflea algicola]MCY0147062.1 GDYXXLXY domain-containing protein [Hoeflea algicola]